MDPGIDDLKRIALWVKQHSFRRIAIQSPDDLLPSIPKVVLLLRRDLPDRKVFVLGDSTYGGSSVDEVGAEHYGADCIVKFGPSDQQRGSSLPVLYVFGRATIQDTDSRALVDALKTRLGEKESSLVIICDVALRTRAWEIGQSLSREMQGSGEVFLADPESETSQATGELVSRHDWRFGVLSAGSWMSVLGTLLLAASARPQPLRICGRVLRRVSSLASDGGAPGPGPDTGISMAGHLPRQLPKRCGFLYVGTADSALEKRLLLRHGHGHPIWRLQGADSCGKGSNTSSLLCLSDQAESLLLRRHRFVEIARGAAVFGLLLCSSSASHSQHLAWRLEGLLQGAGRRSHRFLLGKPTAEKLGNFPGVECYVSLAGPEQFPFESRDLPVPVASPFELEVALGARAWTGAYITDAEELLREPLLCLQDPGEMLSVQTLGASARVRTFGLDNSRAALLRGTADTREHEPEEQKGAGVRLPAAVQPGLHGIPARYVSEAPC